MLGTLQLLVTVALLVAGTTARGPPGSNGIRYYDFGGTGFTGWQGGVKRRWKNDRWVAKAYRSKRFATGHPVWTKWFPRLYQSHRYMPNMKPLWINLFVRPGEYSVQLLFCETYFNGPNKRLFKIKLNGRWYFNGRFTRNPRQATVVDIWRMAGGKWRPRVLTVHLMPAWRGSINIELVPVRENAFISGAIIAPVHSLRHRKTPALWTGKGNANA